MAGRPRVLVPRVGVPERASVGRGQARNGAGARGHTGVHLPRQLNAARGASLRRRLDGPASERPAPLGIPLLTTGQSWCKVRLRAVGACMRATEAESRSAITMASGRPDDA